VIIKSSSASQNHESCMKLQNVLCVIRRVSRSQGQKKFENRMKKKPYERSICSDAFSLKKELKNHITSIHDGIRCSVCFKIFYQRWFERTYCKRMVIFRRTIPKSFSLVHEGIKLFECSICERKFSTIMHISTNSYDSCDVQTFLNLI
jgi:hypothetical protein